jgi:hypothetical protein
VLVSCSRVLTVQYFAWWISFFGLIPELRFDSVAVVAWIVTLFAWLGVAYCLEFLGSWWAISVLQFCASMFFLAQMNFIASV